MRRRVIAILVLMSTGVAAAAEDCSKAVTNAIEKQRSSKAFRMETSQPTAEGPIKMTVDYMPPDRMLQTVTGANLPGEQQTLLVGGRAFAGTNGAYEELLPQFAQSIVAEFQRSVGKPEKVATFECQGEVTFEGKSYLAYMAVDKAAPAGKADELLARTVYVDPKTGLPAYNIVALASGKGDPVMKVSYSYPPDIVIEAPKNAPVQKGPR